MQRTTQGIRLAWFTLLLLAAIASIPASAQTSQPPEEDPPPETVDEALLTTDEGSLADPYPDPAQVTLGQDLLPYDGPLEALDDPDDYAPEERGTLPSVGLFSAATTGCAANNRNIFPIRVGGGGSTDPCPAGARYLSFRGNRVLLVSASADNACHFQLPASSNFCHLGNHAQIFDGLRARGLNKIRLWVALAAEPNPANLPFLQVTENGETFWRLDQPNRPYFSRLRQVVEAARARDLFVEVTFFAPFEGAPNMPAFAQGPWGGKGKAPNANGVLETVKFTQPEFAVIDGPNDNPAARAMHARMRAFQRNVIRWTVDELWCYENVYWEIANEPETEKVDPLRVAEWQRARIQDVRNAEAPHRQGRLRAPHLIAVQPFSREGAIQALQNSEIAIVNGHYTFVGTDLRPTLPDNRSTSLDSGALRLIQDFGNRCKVFGFNETKISPLGGTAGTRSHLSGALQQGAIEAQRAEAWEFLFSQGAIYDGWAYLSGNPRDNPPALWDQLKVLRNFMAGLPLERLRSSGSNPAWVTVGDYPFGLAGLDRARVAQRHHAALQTDPAQPNRLFLLYFHHSTQRCIRSQGSRNTEVEFDPSAGCTRSNDSNFKFMTRNGFDARVWPNQRFQSTFRLKLGPQPGRFELSWITPATGMPSQPQVQVVQWNPASGGTCNGGSCVVTSPQYDFDITLRVQETAP